MLLSSFVGLNCLKYKESLLAFERGDENAKRIVAFCKLSGRGGVEVDYEGAAALLEDCVKKGDSDAMWMLGLCCEYGKGIEQDTERSRLLFQNSSEAGNAAGEFLSLHDTGSGVIAVDWWGSL